MKASIATPRSAQRKQPIRVTSLSPRATVGWLIYGNFRMRCALGRSGLRTMKREGDGATPRGTWRLGQVFYRSDRIQRPRITSASPLSALKRNDGWCDAPSDRNYNRFVRRPYPASAEQLWRGDRLYDLIVVLGYNDRPRLRGRGSAVFLHVARDGCAPTEGCVALKKADLLRLLAVLRPGAKMVIGRP